VDTTLGTTDPSHPAFYLEGQDDTPNMRGFWTLAACIATPGAAAASDAGVSSGTDAGASVGADAGGGACTNGFDCCSGFCQNGVCVDIGQVACQGLGGSCTTSGDCCNSSAVTCTGGVCSAVVQ
jgi:hypothetical protein